MKQFFASEADPAFADAAAEADAVLVRYPAGTFVLTGAEKAEYEAGSIPVPPVPQPE